LVWQISRQLDRGVVGEGIISPKIPAFSPAFFLAHKILANQYGGSVRWIIWVVVSESWGVALDGVALQALPEAQHRFFNLAGTALCDNEAFWVDLAVSKYLTDGLRLSWSFSFYRFVMPIERLCYICRFPSQNGNLTIVFFKVQCQFFSSYIFLSADFYLRSERVFVPDVVYFPRLFFHAGYLQDSGLLIPTPRVETPLAVSLIAV